jgi:undecaprenyl-diphosphatase
MQLSRARAALALLGASLAAAGAGQADVGRPSRTLEPIASPEGVEPQPACLTPPPGAPPRSARRVGAYAFEVSHGDTTPEASGAGPPGVLVGASLAAGRFGRGLALDGTSAYLRIEEPGWPTGDYTHAAWVWPRRSDAWRALIEIQTPASRGLEIAVAARGGLEVWSSGSLRLPHAGSLARGEWSHVALTRAGSLVTSFVDGVAQRAGRDGASFDFGKCPALIGVDADSGCSGALNGFFDGVIDELRIYDCALSAEGIRSILQAPLEPSARAAPGPDAPSERAAPGRQRLPARASVPDWDLWLLARLAAWVGRSPGLARFLEQGVAYGALGGVWYAAALFVLWVRGAQPGQEEVRRRVLALALGSAVALASTFLAAAAVSWPPPSAHPELAGLYPESLGVNQNENAFPSQSTAFFAAISAGLYALRRAAGAWAWSGVGLLVALPRMLLGGHYASDVLAGLLLGLAGHGVSARLLAPKLVPWCELAFASGWSDGRRILAEGLAFLWILQVASGFGLVRWIATALESAWR